MILIFLFSTSMILFSGKRPPRTFKYQNKVPDLHCETEIILSGHQIEQVTCFYACEQYKSNNFSNQIRFPVKASTKSLLDSRDANQGIMLILGTASLEWMLISCFWDWPLTNLTFTVLRQQVSFSFDILQKLKLKCNSIWFKTTPVIIGQLSTMGRRKSPNQPVERNISNYSIFPSCGNASIWISLPDSGIIWQQHRSHTISSPSLMAGYFEFLIEFETKLYTK